MLLDYVVIVVVKLFHCLFFTTTLTTLPLGNNTPQRQGDITHYFSPRRVAVFLSHIRSNDYLLPHEMLLDYIVCVVVILTTSYSYVLTTTLTTLPSGNNSPQRQGDFTHYFSPRRVAVLLPHEMLLDYVV